MHVPRPSPLRRRLATAALAGLLAASGWAVAAAPPASAAPVGITGGHIEWGVKESFRSYIAGPIAHGSISLASSVSGIAPVNRAPAVNVPVRTQSDQSVLGSDVYRFGVLPTGTNDSATRTASVSSGGVVRFEGHEGLLDVTIDHVRVELDGDSGTVITDLTSKGLADPSAPPVLFDDVALASLDLTGITPTSSGGFTTYADVPAALTEDGAPAFAGFYTPGTALDPVTIVVRDAAAEPAAVVGQAVDSGSVRWTISRQVWGQTSLNQCLIGLDGATVVGTPSDASFDDPANGASFPVADGAYDASTGATELDLAGTVVLGNYNRGNYRIRLADPSLTIDASGSGALTADVSYSLSPGGPPPTDCDLAGRTFVPGGDDVVIATFDGDLSGDDQLSGELTPDFEENVFSADPRFTSALDASLRGHFSVSNGNPNTSGLPAVDASHRKVLQPIRVGLDLADPVPTTLDLTPATADKATGTEHCVTAQVDDELGASLSGAAVTFAVTGANPNEGSAITDAAGTAQHCFTGSVAGVDTISAMAGDASDSATVTWSAPPATANPFAALLQQLQAAVDALLRSLQSLRLF